MIGLTFTSEEGTNTFDNNQPTLPENSPVDTVIGTLKGEHEDLTQDMVFDVQDSEGVGIVKLSDVVCDTQV